MSAVTMFTKGMAQDMVNLMKSLVGEPFAYRKEPEGRATLYALKDIIEGRTQCIDATPTKAAALLSTDDAETILSAAIDRITYGNKTDDKLILDELRKVGVCLARFSPASPAPLACTDCGSPDVAAYYDGRSYCSPCGWKRATVNPPREGDAPRV